MSSARCRPAKAATHPGCRDPDHERHADRQRRRQHAEPLPGGCRRRRERQRLRHPFGAGTTAGYVENQAGTGGTLSVTDGAHTVNIALLGHYSADDFTVAADDTTGTLLSFRDHLVI